MERTHFQIAEKIKQMNNNSYLFSFDSILFEIRKFCHVINYTTIDDNFRNAEILAEINCFFEDVMTKTFKLFYYSYIIQKLCQIKLINNKLQYGNTM